MSMKLPIYRENSLKNMNIYSTKEGVLNNRFQKIAPESNSRHASEGKKKTH